MRSLLRHNDIYSSYEFQAEFGDGGQIRARSRGIRDHHSTLKLSKVESKVSEWRIIEKLFTEAAAAGYKPGGCKDCNR